MPPAIISSTIRLYMREQFLPIARFELRTLLAGEICFLPSAPIDACAMCARFLSDKERKCVVFLIDRDADNLLADASRVNNLPIYLSSIADEPVAL